MVWDIRTATNYAKHHAHTHSIKKCAEYTRKAIRAGGIDIGNTGHAKDYGSLLMHAGFRPVSPYESPRAGDVVICNRMREETQAVIWLYLMDKTGIPISNNVICGQVLVTEQQNHNIRYTGGTNAIYSPINPFTVIRM